MFEIFLKRPVLAIVCNILIILAGVWGYLHLPIREYPAIDNPMITVQMTYGGAGPALVESQITQVAEEALAGTENLRLITATSTQGKAKLTLEFNPSVSPNDAAAEVRDKLDRVRSRFPQEMDNWTISKADLDGGPLIRLAFWSDEMSQTDISDYISRFVKDRLLALDGVADLSIFGNRTLGLMLHLDPLKMAAYQITMAEIETAIKTQHVEYPAGLLEKPEKDIFLQLKGRLTTPEEFGQIILRQEGTHPLRLEDVATIRFEGKDERSFSRFNGKTAVMVGIIPQPTANTIALADAFYRLLPALEKDLPPRLNLEKGFDNTLFVRESLKNLWKTVGETILLVAGVTWLFLRSASLTLVPMVAIPVSLVGTFFFLMALGYSLNLLTLLALVLAVGLVVDDAIVVMESIVHEKEKGRSTMDAAIEGVKKVAFPVLGMTLTLVAVYIPLTLIEGRVGALFSEFAVALSGAVLISGFTAVTLTPLLCTWMMPKTSPAPSAPPAPQKPWWELGWAPTLVLMGLSVGGSYVILPLLHNEMAPAEDRGMLLFNGRTPEGTSPRLTHESTGQLEALLEKVPEKEYVLGVTGGSDSNELNAVLALTPWGERERTEQDIAQSLKQSVAGLPNAQATYLSASPLSQSRFGKPIQYVIQSPLPWEDILKVAQDVLKKARQNPDLQAADVDVKLSMPQIDFTIDRTKAALAGVSPDEIARSLQALYGQRKWGEYAYLDRQYDIISRLRLDWASDIQILKQVYVRSGEKMLPLSDFVIINETTAARRLSRFDRLRSVTMSAGLSPTASLGETIAWFEKEITPALPQGFKAAWAGPARDFQESRSDMGFVFMGAGVAIYLLLAVLFDSWRRPLVILLTLPVSILSGLGVLYLFGISLNIYTQIGLLTLIGLVTKHGVLVVDVAAALQREQGLSIRQAVSQGLRDRLRPILMTTVAMVIGAVPLMFSHGAGAGAQQSIGTVLAGGLLLGTLGVILSISGIYILVMGIRNKKII